MRLSRALVGLCLAVACMAISVQAAAPAPAAAAPAAAAAVPQMPEQTTPVKGGSQMRVPWRAAEAGMDSKGDALLNIDGSQIHIHVTQASAPEPNAKVLRAVESRLEGLHSKAMTQIEALLVDVEAHKKAAAPCLRRLRRTVRKFKDAFVAESSAMEKISHKYSYADDAPTLAL